MQYEYGNCKIIIMLTARHHRRNRGPAQRAIVTLLH